MASDVTGGKSILLEGQPKQVICCEIDCDGCERKVENSVNPMKGAESAELSKEEESRETVNGCEESEKVLKMVTNTEFWPFAQYNLDSYPYVDGVYEHEAPSGYVRNDPQELPSSSDPSEILTSLFSDDNPNACSVM
ncbi:Heavy metal-associated isoprenylated plant protein 22 [Linum grandiflorum]